MVGCVDVECLNQLEMDNGRWGSKIQICVDIICVSSLAFVALASRRRPAWSAALRGPLVLFPPVPEGAGEAGEQEEERHVHLVWSQMLLFVTNMLQQKCTAQKVCLRLRELTVAASGGIWPQMGQNIMTPFKMPNFKLATIRPKAFVIGCIGS